MTTNQHDQEEMQEDINARLALISKAVAEKLTGRQRATSDEESIGREQNMLIASTCPVDPMERLLCEGCQ